MLGVYFGGLCGSGGFVLDEYVIIVCSMIFFLRISLVTGISI